MANELADSIVTSILSKRKNRTRSGLELLGDPPPPPSAMLEPSLIVQGGETVLAAPTKVGKTNLWLHFAFALTEGTTLWRTFAAPSPVRVLLLELELSEAIMYRRLSALRDLLGWSDGGLERLTIRCARALTLNRQAGQKAILDIIAETPGGPPDLVILDSFNAAVRGDADKTSDAREALHSLHEIQDKTGITWGLTGEIRKAPAGAGIRYSIDDLKGSNELAYDADAVLILRPDRGNRRRLAVDFAAMRHDDSSCPEGLVLVRDGLSFELVENGEARERELREEAIRGAVREVLQEHLQRGGGRTWKECVAAVRAAGVSARNDLITEIRRELLMAQPQQPLMPEDPS